MNQFSRLTGIPYDRVWIFPYSIGPEPVLSHSQTKGISCDGQFRNGPSRFGPACRPSFTISKCNSLLCKFSQRSTIWREGGLTSSFLAIQSFLGNPILLYVHQGFFASGIDAFDPYADQINRINPHTAWTSLGEIIRHAYLMKRRDDGQYDIRAYSSDILISNPDPQTRTFHVEKAESAPPALDSVSS